MGSTNASVPIPNLISGVSQQPSTIRLSTAAQAMENAWPSVITGLNKRPPSEHIARLGVDAAGGAVGYLIDRDDSYQYIVTATNNKLQVFDFQGNEKVVTAPKGFTYLNTSDSPVDDFRFLTFGDTTFVLNKKVVVKEDSYGEDGLSSYVPDGTVLNYANLPTNPPIGNVYLVSSEGNYYKRVHTAATADTLKWQYQYTASTTEGNGPAVTSLPPAKNLGQICYLRLAAAHFDRYQVINNPGVPASDSGYLL